MTLPDETRIAGDKTIADWKDIKRKLTNGASSGQWNMVFHDFFKARMETRYFDPIRVLECMQQDKGEGFAIVALHCTLIEFLASMLVGKTYKYQRNGQPPLGQFEYSSSRDVFITFLKQHEPFKDMFATADSAENFYASVRCGLLHEARTKNGWRIKVGQSEMQAVDTTAKVVYRNKMQSVFDEFVGWYNNALLDDAELQDAFIRKFDSLCEE